MTLLSVTVSCSLGNSEYHRTAEICRQGLSKLQTWHDENPENPDGVEPNLQEIELILLQSTKNNALFSAVGLFDIEFGLLLDYFYSITSYVIIIIQVNQ